MSYKGSDQSPTNECGSYNGYNPEHSVFCGPAVEKHANGDQDTGRDHGRESIFGLHDPVVLTLQVLDELIAGEAEGNQPDHHPNAQAKECKSRDSLGEAVGFGEDGSNGREEKV